MKKLLLSTTLIVISLLSRPVFAHHGFGGRYDEANPVTVKGTVVDFQFINPHSFIAFETTDPNSKVERWQAELASATSLHRSEHWTKDILKVGDQITLIGPRAKNGSNDLNLSHDSRIIMTDTGKEIHNSIGSTAQQGPPAAY